MAKPIVTKRPKDAPAAEAYRGKVEVALRCYAADLADRAGREQPGTSRHTTYVTWSANAVKAADAIGDVDSGAAWSSVASAPERPEDLARILAGEVKLENGGDPMDPITFFVGKVKAAMS
jgi:hypothetical protein